MDNNAIEYTSISLEAFQHIECITTLGDYLIFSYIRVLGPTFLSTIRRVQSVKQSPD